MSESPTKTSWENFAELAMMEYVKFQMITRAPTKTPPTASDDTSGRCSEMAKFTTPAFADRLNNFMEIQNETNDISRVGSY
jgi:hypothetical protein